MWLSNLEFAAAHATVGLLENGMRNDLMYL